MTYLIYFLWAVIALVMLVLMSVILLQEGKGGGLAEAFGGAGGETFGVKSSGINRFTGILGGVFLVLVVVINLCIRWHQDSSVLPGVEPAPTVIELPAGFGDETDPGAEPK